MAEETETEVQPKQGHQVIQAYLKTIDSSPGVYRMLDSESRVLYVGKARNLRARVSSYARPTGHSGRIARMIASTASMMFLTTRTETEALLLEQNLIKQLKPKFNVLLRDDKSFPNILVTADSDYPQIKKHRGAKKEKGAYYGPFASAGAVNRTLNQLQRVFLLRDCSNSMFESRTRPCLQYQIKRCSAPCVGKISPQDYQQTVQDAEKFLSGKSTDIQARLGREMAQASEDMEFERAAALRDRIKALTQVQTAQGINPKNVDEADVIALHMENGQACVQVFFIRAGQNWGNHDYYPRVGADVDPAEVLEAFVGQFYDTREPPRQLILSNAVENPDLMADALGQKLGRKVELLVPQRGEKAELIDSALRNARESLARKMAETATQARLLQGLAEAFDLPKVPERVEVYDNSHIQGAHAVGAMIVAGPDGFMKNQYRKFNIRGDELTPGDDFGMMKEVLNRRFKRLLKEDPDRTRGMWPDLLLIDGGAGQVSAVREIMEDHGVGDIPMVGVAKGLDRDAGKEEFHRTGKTVKALRHNDPVLYFIQRMRDEAHRFAIGTHRAKRSKAVGATPLDDVPGVGAARKRALLAHFGSAKAVARANLADLKAVDGVSAALAQKIYDYFQTG
ncbi:excinuclease ABC subunit UvrC [Pseudosulfitobacter pseudonitzschiae]|uniref:excinuclease ABC subunit UvrC n=1 Tax=Pseudosulfitobacter pseudonitzschiae TaxID=1402135 RepID=UPI001AFB5BC7|nr:excinuclease ABC subunit UvrC [Pseudosulfitobacter pseudonitzschiae]MBM1814223.1 excinuclease ABC subunit UvrC [Pseudosulfitobacter pseudonitzschiae]MBM1831216.1 excinuclease ABC subunit UvrC [Pseudosulfitobacter pseudonitzschiae]MBM1836083.1 excinuclease ABC subunit UvrC [Pseudosulfitobacter pseudonitzschiae]MBM1840929.1 excinuclease ABC subunit UvrC [Pseudosulfitobacter pseudonitzschiae]MBM1845083.1 excinuclease ABC subunit UvrC [Pseudosulfitobacter pseudonitzschiae]